MTQGSIVLEQYYAAKKSTGNESAMDILATYLAMLYTKNVDSERSQSPALIKKDVQRFRCYGIEDAVFVAKMHHDMRMSDIVIRPDFEVEGNYTVEYVDRRDEND